MLKCNYLLAVDFNGLQLEETSGRGITSVGECSSLSRLIFRVTALGGRAGTCHCNCSLMNFLSPLIVDLIVFYDQCFAKPASAKRNHNCWLMTLVFFPLNIHNTLKRGELSLHLGSSRTLSLRLAAVFLQPAFPNDACLFLGLWM